MTKAATKKTRKCGACGEAGHQRQRCPKVPYSSKAPSADEIKRAQDLIVELLEGGNFLETAASAAGITPERCRTWLRLGTDPQSPYADFRREVLRAMAASEAQALQLLTKAAANGDAKQVQWWLERRHPAKWSLDVRKQVESQFNAILDRIESLESIIGAEAVNIVLEAITGDDGAREIEQTADQRIH